VTDAVVMAAGEGSRLRPLTERWPKPILPIDGRPVIATLLRELGAAGLERVFVVTGHLAEQVEELVGDGSGFGVEVVYARQPRALGSADAVRRALEAGVGAPFLVVAADTVFAPGDIAAFVHAVREAPGAIAYRVAPGRAALLVEDGRVKRVVDRNPENPHASAPLWWLGAEIVPFLDDLGGPPYELAEALQRGVDSGLAVAAVEIRPTRDLTHPADVVRENFPYLARPGS
jgi:UDP-N-acetylglucosamine diphosphorylase / glucose-1-phosphate thymidylyltransferase / UDP-N-acetylgalactosamine diphosphorylase / glucosamine-1-phosphate N-acetyltransferase / galactosamine-1-phosphate N-acetyltransferase